MALDVAAVVTTVRTLAGVVKESGKIELYQKVLELQQWLHEAISENMRLAGENNQLADKLRSLERELAEVRAELKFEFDGHVYWLGTLGELGNGPYCPRCKDKDHRNARMSDSGNGFMCCASCDHCVDNEKLKYPKLNLSKTYRQQPRGYFEGDLT